jgi:hypothetical protein
MDRSEDLVSLLDGENHLCDVELGETLLERILLDQQREEI